MPNDLQKMFVKVIAVARVVIMQIIARYAVLKGLYHLIYMIPLMRQSPPGRYPSAMNKCIRNTLTRLIFARFLRELFFANAKIKLFCVDLFSQMVDNFY